MELNTSANKCFVCGPGNPAGLNIRFALDDDVCKAEWTSTEDYVGYDGVTHGGILFCLLDDVMANLLFLKGEVCLTAKADIRYRKSMDIGETVLLESRLKTRKGRLAIIEGKLLSKQDRSVIAEATGTFMVSSS